MRRSWKIGEFDHAAYKAEKAPKKPAKPTRPVKKERQFSVRIGDNVALMIAPRWFDISCGHCKAFRDELNAMTPEHVRAVVDPLAARLVTNMERIAGMKVQEVGFWKSAFVAAAFHGLKLTVGLDGIYDYARVTLLHAADKADEVLGSSPADVGTKHGAGGHPVGAGNPAGVADSERTQAVDGRNEPEILSGRDLGTPGTAEPVTPAASPADGGAHG